MIHLIIDADNDVYNEMANILDIYKTNDKAISQDSVLYNLIDDLFWKIGFNQTAKGTYYLKRAILIAYLDQNLLYKNKELIELTSKELNIEAKAVRSAIDNSLHTMYRFTTVECLTGFFHDNYDGRKPSAKYFIALCVNYLNSITGKEAINMFHFI